MDTARLTAEMTLSLQGPLEAQISPDGTLVAYNVGELAASGGALPALRLVVHSVADDVATTVTPSDASAMSPRWAPDLQALAYLLAELDGPHELFLASPWNTPPRKLAGDLGSISDPAWSPDGARIAFLAEDEHDEPKGTGLEWWPEVRPSRIWVVDIASGERSCFSPESLHVWEFAWSPDGESFVAVVSDGPEESSWFGCRLSLITADGSVDLVDGHARDARALPSRDIYRQVAAPTWAPDGSQVAFLMSARSDRDIPGGDVCTVELATGELTNHTRDQPITATSITWKQDGLLTFAAYVSGQQAVCRLDETGELQVLWTDRVTFERFWPRLSSSLTGRIATTKEGPSSPREVWIADPTDDGLSWSALTNLNDSVRSWPHPVVDVVQWTADDGTELSGLFLKPQDAPSRMPMVTWIHGGPNFLHKHSFFGAANPWMISAIPALLASAGFAVFLPNPRGSLGWGSVFAETVLGDMGGADASDILSGVDACIETYDDVDPTRLGVGGWSYGGFMSAWLIAHSPRFRAAVVGAGTVNWRSQHGTSTIGLWIEQYLQDEPYRIGGAYDLRSPLTYVESVTTATMLLHGSADSIVPPGQALEFAAGLRRTGCPVELRFYEGEGHDITGRDAQLRVAADVSGWFERWLQGEEPGL